MRLALGDHVRGKKEHFRGTVFRVPYFLYGYECVDVLVNESGKQRILTVQTNSLCKIRPPKRIRDLKKAMSNVESLST